MSVTALVPILVLVPVVASIGRLVPRASHMAKEEVVAENLLLLELRFLRDALGTAGDNRGDSDRPRSR